MERREDWINPQIIDLKLSRWKKEKGTSYIGRYNKLYFGCVIKSSDITPLDIVNAILLMDIPDEMYSWSLSKKKCKIKDKVITFYLSIRRVEISYGLPN